METYQQLYYQPSKLWVWSVLAAMSLVALIAVISIRSGPSVQHAALAIHRARVNVLEICVASTGVQSPAIQDAEAELSLALAALAERRYSTAVSAATKASHLAEQCNLHNQGEPAGRAMQPQEPLLSQYGPLPREVTPE